MDKFHYRELRPDTAAASYGARRLATGRRRLPTRLPAAQVVVLNSTASKDCWADRGKQHLHEGDCLPAARRAQRSSHSRIGRFPKSGPGEVRVEVQRSLCDIVR